MPSRFRRGALAIAIPLLVTLPVNLATAWYRLLSPSSATGKVRAARAPVDDVITNDAGPVASP